jgi:cell wall-associated NlpC family hydrolase
MTPLPSALWFDLLGKPFASGARGPDAYDCVGLLIEIYRRMGITVPEWGSHVRELASARGLWMSVTEPIAGDAVLLRSDDPPWHVAVVTGEGWMIHAHPASGVVRERYNAFPWQARIEGFYRWKRV